MEHNFVQSPNRIIDADSFKFNSSIVIDMKCSEDIYRKNLEQAKLPKNWKFPYFIIIISLIEIGVFIQDEITSNSQQHTRIRYDSILIFNPERRHEIWRYFSYIFLHVNWFHLCFNLLVQLIIGVQLEISQGFLRVVTIYFSGVLAASLGTNICEPYVYLIGSSSGVYSLLAAYQAHILLNFDNLKHSMLKLIPIFIFVSIDFGYSMYYIRYQHDYSIPPVSFMAHLISFIVGFIIGTLFLKTKLNDKLHFRNILWWLSLGVILALIVFVILYYSFLFFF